MRRRTAIVMATALAASCQAALPCTTFCLVDGAQVIFGKNYDWDVGHGLLVVNKRGVEKSATALSEGAPARWTSRHGSITFNQYGRGFPSGGMNEAGLVIELMWLDETAYPSPDARPAVGVLEWIQYQLDTAATVPELVASDRVVRISSRTPLHYLVADRDGRAASIEFLGGKLEVHTGSDMRARALTNSTYRESLAFLDRSRGVAVPRSGDSLSRFALAARRASAYRNGGAQEGVRYAFETLEQVAGARTQWRIVYEVGSRRVSFSTKRQPEVRSISLDSLDLSCRSPVLILDLDEPGSGDVTGRLVPYTLGANLRLVRAAYAETRFLSGVGQDEIRAVAGAPEAEVCRSP